MSSGIYKRTEEHKRKIKNACKGKKFPFSWKGLTRRPFSKEHIQKLKEAHYGQVAWNKGLKGYLKGRKITWANKISAGKKSSLKSTLASRKAGKRMGDNNKGENNWNWQGGISFDLYGLEFNEKLKEVIRNRDKRKCQLCEKTELENKAKLSVHHIDYNKQNNNLSNLISLCVNCHMQTNSRRAYWSAYFKNYE